MKCVYETWKWYNNAMCWHLFRLLLHFGLYPIEYLCILRLAFRNHYFTLQLNMTKNQIKKKQSTTAFKFLSKKLQSPKLFKSNNNINKDQQRSTKEQQNYFSLHIHTTMRVPIFGSGSHTCSVPWTIRAFHRCHRHFPTGSARWFVLTSRYST